MLSKLKKEGKDAFIRKKVVKDKIFYAVYVKSSSGVSPASQPIEAEEKVSSRKGNESEVIHIAPPAEMPAVTIEQKPEVEISQKQTTYTEEPSSAVLKDNSKEETRPETVTQQQSEKAKKPEEVTLKDTAQEQISQPDKTSMPQRDTKTDETDISHSGAKVDDNNAPSPLPSPTRGEGNIGAAIGETPTVEKTEVEKTPEIIYPQTHKGAKRKFLGIGGFADTLNFSAGPTLILWPLKNLALQGTYGSGTFKTYEARAFYRFNLWSRLNPYIGAGYFHVERKASVIGVDTKIKGNSFIGFAGLELSIYKNIFGYVEVGGTPLKLDADITNGSRKAKATVDYSPVTIGTGLVLYLF
ncbi:MAG: hypothetical protein HY754_03310 [Nitrospirae bacterium]|nr:hypothetical protein [Nitrospirota bacterium]